MLFEKSCALGYSCELKRLINCTSVRENGPATLYIPVFTTCKILPMKLGHFHCYDLVMIMMPFYAL